MASRAREADDVRIPVAQERVGALRFARGGPLEAVERTPFARDRESLSERDRPTLQNPRMEPAVRVERTTCSTPDRGGGMSSPDTTRPEGCRSAMCGPSSADRVSPQAENASEVGSQVLRTAPKYTRPLGPDPVARQAARGRGLTRIDMSPRTQDGTLGGIRTPVARFARTRGLSAAPPQVRSLAGSGRQAASTSEINDLRSSNCIEPH